MRISPKLLRKIAALAVGVPLCVSLFSLVVAWLIPGCNPNPYGLGQCAGSANLAIALVFGELGGVYVAILFGAFIAAPLVVASFVLQHWKRLDAMDIQIPATEFELVVAMGDLVLWSDASDGPMGHHPQFQAVLDALGARIELTPLVKAYFEDTARTGRGDVHVFELGNDSSAVLAIDAYSEPDDQLDLIALYIRCKRAESRAISEFVWKFFNSCSVQAHASQQSICMRLRDAIDPAKFPRSVGSSGFMQSQIRHRVA